MKELGLYIHIPFCKKKCDYCDFISYSGKGNCIKEYVEDLKNEIKHELNKVINNSKEDYIVTTIYFGGGTPSFISSKHIVEIINTIKKYIVWADDPVCPLEVTLEVNPGTVTIEKLEDYKKIGINRLSIGLQETNNQLLESIGRIHTYEDFLKTYNLARNVGFKNINVDLMIGLPNQSIENIKKSLEKIISLNPEHISVYSLILEEGTPLYYRCENDDLKLPDEELERNMYWYVKNTLENAGYIHYEISNFTKKDYESKHNVNCWEQKEYLGFGLAAHSYFNKERYANTTDMKEYLEFKGLNCKITYEKQNDDDTKKEYMLLGLRKINGVSIQKFKNKFGENPIFLFKNELSKLVEQNLLIIDGDCIKLTNKGLDLANLVWEEFI